MPRPVSIQNDSIVKAARKVFLKSGFKATTAQVAREARISEGSIFKHFKSKTALFMAAMHVETRAQDWQDRLTGTVGCGDIRETLVFTGQYLLQRLQTILPRIMMVRASGIVFARDFLMPDPPPPIQHLRMLAGYFRAEIKRGRLTMRSPEIQAQAFIGALSHYALCETMYGYRPAPPAAYVRDVVDTFLHSALPHAPRAPRGKKSPAREQGANRR